VISPEIRSGGLVRGKARGENKDVSEGSSQRSG
jgi:hypothetical protein